MARTTDALVEGIVTVLDGTDLTPFIAAANSIVTDVCTDSSYSDAKLTLIETWLAAHCYQIFDQAVASEDAKGVASSYQYKIGLHIQQTKYGQMAMVLDTDGNLAALSKRMEDGEAATISLTWLGTDYDTEDES